MPPHPSYHVLLTLNFEPKTLNSVRRHPGRFVGNEVPAEYDPALAGADLLDLQLAGFFQAAFEGDALTDEFGFEEGLEFPGQEGLEGDLRRSEPLPLQELNNDLSLTDELGALLGLFNLIV